jgi:hypothetical protein
MEWLSTKPCVAAGAVSQTPAYISDEKVIDVKNQDLTAVKAALVTRLATGLAWWVPVIRERGSIFTLSPSD